MIKRPKFKDKYVVEIIPGDGTFLLSESGNYIVYGAAVEAVSTLLDGTRTRDEVVSTLEHSFGGDEVQAAISMLEREGHLQDQPEYDVSVELSAFWSELGVEISNLPKLLASVRVHVVGIGAADPERLTRRLRALGFTTGDQPNFIFVACDDYEHPDIADINRLCLDKKIPWIIFKPTGVNIWVGPIFVPGRTACWSCLQSRLTRNREVEGYVRGRTRNTLPYSTSRARLKSSKNRRIRSRSCSSCGCLWRARTVHWSRR